MVFESENSAYNQAIDLINKISVEEVIRKTIDKDINSLHRKAGLPEHAVAALLTVLGEDPRVQGLVLYGSRAMDRYRRGSDIDLCLEAPAMALPDLWQLADRVDDLLLPWKVDLQLRHSIDNPDLLAHIDRVGQAWLRR